ncbi:sugar phosphate isomerase/epimerase [Candidatus Poribacteria bacterium]|nr:sugar phosphate isomerase/epimerase [Candidatus Poribacteria bacterium]MYB66190.1 sugar phosphate isomerase/epimerase [Candidatus Poribacteria bacterium]MYF56905.1 sugar phosphate isomerase/epimerase [Candidatus Poribacteria bacterium]MYI92964.1 sugar phosphate isomerase/epimerase [Candidatus Poribacteria bacterium]
MGQFQLGLNTSTIRPANLMDKIRIAGETGYSAIELWNNDLTDYEEQGGSLTDVKKALDDHGLSVPTVIALHGWLNATGVELQNALEDAKKRMAQAAAVGATYIISSPPREVADLQLGGENYRKLLELGREFGVKPAMEFLGFVDGVNQVKHAWEVIEVADHPDSTIVLDPFHIYRGGGEIEDMEGIPGDKIAVFHFNDAPAEPAREEQTDADRVYPGDGILDLKRMITILQDANYKGVISLELFNPSYWEEDPAKVARIGLEKMKSAIDPC